MKNVGIDNLLVNQIYQYDDNDLNDYEEYYINLFKNNGYIVINEQLNDYHPKRQYKYFDKRDEIWNCFKNESLSREEIRDKYNISDSLLSKIISENNGSTRKPKLYQHYEEIQEAILSGVSIRELARKYNVSKNSIANINNGKTAYNCNLSYPLNEKVREKIIKESQFKPKVQSGQ